MGLGCAAQMGMGFPGRICIFAVPAAGGACGWHQPGSASALLPPALVAFLHFLIARAQRTPSVVALTVGLAQVAKSPECLGHCLRVPL